MGKLYDIAGYEDRYAITKTGKVWSYPKKNNFGLKKGKWLTPVVFSNGYYFVSLSKNKKVKKYSIHRLVAEAFIVNKDNKREVNHKDCNKLNNNIDNLEWMSSRENTIHGIKNGRYENARKAAIKQGKLKKIDIENIFNLHNNGVYHKDIAKTYNCCRQHIDNIINKKVYKHVS